MLPAAHRLRSSDEFRRCIRGGRRCGGRLLVVHLFRSPAGHLAALPEAEPESGSGGPPKAGFVVSRAVGNAVVRNRVKRRLRHLVRERIAELPDGTLLVVRALAPAATASYPELGEALDRSLQRCLRDAQKGG